MVNITGKVFYLDSNKPINGAMVMIYNSYPEIYTYTDANGFFSIPIEGVNTLVFSHEKTNQSIKKTVSEKMESFDIGIISMMNELEPKVCPPVQSNNKKVLFGFVTGVLVGSLFFKKITE